MKHTGITEFDATVPNEIGGLNAFEALLAASRFGKSVLDTDLVARAYPMIYHTIRCLNGIPVTPAAISNGSGKDEVSLIHYHISWKLTNILLQIFTVSDMYEVEKQMRQASVNLGSLGGICINPIYGVEAKTLPPNSFSHGDFPLPYRDSLKLTYYERGQ